LGVFGATTKINGSTNEDRAERCVGLGKWRDMVKSKESLVNKTFKAKMTMAEKKLQEKKRMQDGKHFGKMRTVRTPSRSVLIKEKRQ
jgi:uncharacterized iron-regulated protein